MSSTKDDKLVRPTISEGATEGDWVYFVGQWERYKWSANLGEQATVDQLWNCCSETLSRMVFKGRADFTNEVGLMEAIKRLAVRDQNKMVNVTTFLGMR